MKARSLTALADQQSAASRPSNNPKTPPSSNDRALTGPSLALAKEEQREQLEAVREVRALMLEGEDAGLRHECPLVRDMQERIAVMFAAWASAMAGSGRSEELRQALVRVLGEERAGIAAASVVTSIAVSTEPPAAKQEVAPEAPAGETDPPQDRLL